MYSSRRYIDLFGTALKVQIIVLVVLVIVLSWLNIKVTSLNNDQSALLDYEFCTYKIDKALTQYVFSRSKISDANIQEYIDLSAERAACVEGLLQLLRSSAADLSDYEGIALQYLEDFNTERNYLIRLGKIHSGKRMNEILTKYWPKEKDKLSYHRSRHDTFYNVRFTLEVEAQRVLTIFFSLSIIVILLFIAICLTVFVFFKYINKEVIHPLYFASNALPTNLGEESSTATSLSLIESKSLECNLLFSAIDKYSEKVDKLKTAAVETAEKKTRFVNFLSHEIRTPLNAIIGNLDLADQDKTFNQEALEDVITASRLLDDIINNILDFAALEINSITPQPKNHSLQHILDSVLHTLSYLENEHKVQNDLVIADNVPSNLFVDRFLLSQVMINIISNIIKHSETAIYRIKIIQKNGNLRLRFIDNGKGISKALLPRLFDEFAQSERHQGTSGLGMKIVKESVLLLEGKIHIWSKTSFGTVFQVDIPLLQDSGNATQGPIDTQATSELPVTRMKILVAEDFELNVKLMKRIAKKHHLTMDFASNGREVLDKLNDQSYDLVLMDIQMPVLDGIEASKLIRREQRFAHIPIYALTADSDLVQQEVCTDAGMNGYITKPIKADKLFALLAELEKNSN